MLDDTGSGIASRGIDVHVCRLVVVHGHDEDVLGHEVVLGDKCTEAATQRRVPLVFVEEWPMVKVRVGEDPVDSSTHRAQLGHRRLLDAHSARKVLVAVEQTRRAV